MKTQKQIAPQRAAQARAPKTGGPLQRAADSSPASESLTELQLMADARPTIQRGEDDEVQAKFIQRAEAPAPKTNNTGLPDNLKSGIENLSGMSMDHVRVHRNSDKPATVQAHAYAQGSNIHLAPGQEKHLPHEAWHVVQQAQGRVKPTMQLKGVAVNDDAGLEREADVMGARALQMRDIANQRPTTQMRMICANFSPPIQREVDADLAKSQENVAAAISYASNVSAALAPYRDKVLEMPMANDANLDHFADRMASGLAAWSENFVNKSGAYLFEAELAASETDIHNNPNIYAILGVDTDEQPDLDVITNTTVMSGGPFPTPDHQEFVNHAVEVKASTSPNYESVDKLVAGGMKQLKKREDTGRYDRLVLNLDNTSSHWPITGYEFVHTYGSDYSQIDRGAYDTRLIARIQQMKATYGITLPLWVEGSETGQTYAYTGLI